MITDDMLTVPDVMTKLRVSRWTVYKLIRSGELESVLVSERCRRIPQSALHDYMTRLCEEAA
ncbi:helix-turn-helix domain-containing protein [Sphaerisporangium fuscum]|uniref:helix-turn-helix domain-containing protein n=1 Tax=Sphaerisporangium fuscum TaxID=2835868 RepID=UPI0027E22084|nr:helix-turn-helix domain-containing protein [Sphaerisporangium fuscum]